MTRSDIVVGVDGSTSARAAVRWAAAEAIRRGAPLRLLYAYPWPWPGAPIVPIDDDASTPWARRGAQAVVDKAMAEARAVAPSVSVSGAAVQGDAAAVLLQAASAAALMVVGSRGHGGFVSLVLGSVADHVVAHAACAVVVVRGHAGHGEGHVVVGVDDSAEADLAVNMAFDAAAARGVPLLAVRAWHATLPPWHTSPVPLPFDTAAVEADGGRILSGAVAGWADKYPTVEVDCRLMRGAPSHVLIEASHAAQLIVVGSRGRGGFAGPMLGSVSRQVASHAHCPVLVARPPGTAEPRRPGI